MNRKHIFVLVVLALAGVGIFVFTKSSKDDVNLSDEQIKAKYCHVTADIRNTDVYCQNPELYRQHMRENKVIEN